MATLPPFLDKLLRVNGVNVRVRHSGPTAAPAVVLLHGFPEYWYAWRELLEPLIAAGYQVVLVDQRGYSMSSKPEGADAYTPAKLVGDVIGVLDALELRDVVLIGHDWGGNIAWRVAAQHPDRVQKLVVLNAAHPAVLAQPPAPFSFAPYNLLLRVPIFADYWIVALADRQMRAHMLKHARKGVFTPEDLDLYREEWNREDALRAMLAWWMAPAGPACGKVQAPTLVLWGDRDSLLNADQCNRSVQMCEAGQSTRFPQGGHFVHHDVPDEVATAILGFVGRHEKIRERTRPLRW